MRATGGTREADVISDERTRPLAPTNTDHWADLNAETRCKNVSEQESDEDSAARLRRSNGRIALTLLALSAVFFAGTIFTRLSGNSRVGLMFLGAAILLFLVTAIGRNLRK